MSRAEPQRSYPAYHRTRYFILLMSFEFIVPDMACSSCATAIANAVRSLDSGAQIEADPDTKTVKIDTSRAKTEVEQAIVAAGYTIAGL